ncbi:hypothetical protein BU24DRAFT_495670 [Aaosphaeria arxii CBS 175.79]|uniref:Glyoxalase/fosfomycin resistance/dioxygenase domain-containing protein n=1 Tax=Aaosphaeria arxii CBS 175.79 TaxID=1450172 RepID=A0A6A5XF71_9PLEO|nr:uncharacterized protein BU24DRAFT_495670 [Aaosphaeria arxii CBS 175.79]KAF2011496.1 hypothetical protein BU24DRAFT_495670 [Aaosphaeria arxii CBS 175.79]
MPPVSQFPSARVFLKSPPPNAASSAFSSSPAVAAAAAARRTSLTSSAPLPRPLTTTSSTTSRFPSPIVMQPSSGTEKPSRDTSRAATPNAPIFKIYPPTLQKVKVAWLSTGNSVGFEIFEFTDPPHEPKPAFEYTRSGFFHIAVTAPDVGACVRKVVENGGSQVGETVVVGDGTEAAYACDPWGNVVEVLGCSFESLMANRV